MQIVAHLVQLATVFVNHADHAGRVYNVFALTLQQQVRVARHLPLFRQGRCGQGDFGSVERLFQNHELVDQAQLIKHFVRRALKALDAKNQVGIGAVEPEPPGRCNTPQIAKHTHVDEDDRVRIAFTLLGQYHGNSVRAAVGGIDFKTGRAFVGPLPRDVIHQKAGNCLIEVFGATLFRIVQGFPKVLVDNFVFGNQENPPEFR